MRFRLSPWVVALGFATLTAIGCSSSTNSTQSSPLTVTDDMWEVNGLLLDYSSEFNRGPSKLTDVTKFQQLYPRGFEAVKNGSITVIWGVKVQPSGSAKIVAYQKNAEAEGGSVLLENGQVKQMTAQEFQAAPKAAKK